MALQKANNLGAVPLYPYQKAWVLDAERFCLAVKGRQIGWTFGTTLKHVRKRGSQGGLSVWVSASQRQSDEAGEYIKKHNAALAYKFDTEQIAFPGVIEKATQITYKHNGARIILMPANPDTVRGFSGDVVLDEFGFHRDPQKIWRGAVAIASRGHSIDVISTPNGQQGKYWDLCKAAGVVATGGMERNRWQAGRWSIHWCDIARAVAEGCPIDPVAMREAADDEDTWLQEYCCVFLADAENYIPMELIIAAEHSDTSLALSPELFSAPHGSLFLGMDIGRKKDRTVMWLREKVGDVFWTRAVITLERTPFNVQRQMLFDILPHVQRACIDATGIGAQLAEEAQQEFASRVEPVVFNLENKERMATLGKKALEDRKERIPSNASVRRAFNAVKRYTSPTGHFRFDADRTEAGHADEFWAFVLSGSASWTGVEAASAGSDDKLADRPRHKSMFEVNPARPGMREMMEPPVLRTRRPSVWQV